MAGRAHRLIAGRQHHVTGLHDRVVAVTGRATGSTHLREDFAMVALVEQLGIDRMALPAHVCNRGHAGRRGAMIAVAIVACRRREIALLADHLPVNALVILLELIGRNFVRRHIIGVGMAGATGVSHPCRVHR